MKTGRFARHQRLTQASEFSLVFKDPHKKCGDANMLVLARKNNNSHARLGLAVAKKHLKKAVARNYFKRVIREIFRQHQKELHGFDIVVVARAGSAQISKADFNLSVQNIWRGLIIKCKESS